MAKSKKAKMIEADWETTYADYPGVGKIYDKDVGRFAFKHLRFRDRFNPEKVGFAVINSQLMLFKVFTEDEIPKKKNWKFFRDWGY